MQFHAEECCVLADRCMPPVRTLLWATRPLHFPLCKRTHLTALIDMHMRLLRCLLLQVYGERAAMQLLP